MFSILFADFAEFCHFFTLFVNLPLAISCIYLDAPGKGSPCILRRFSGGPRSFDIFYQILSILVFCVHFCDEFSLDFDISWCPARLRLTLHGVQITLV